MSRYDGRFDAAADAPIDAAELVAEITARTEARNRERQDAIACFLSGSEGWRQALDLLGGAFAPELSGGRRRDD
jgi:hypothetical protein